MQTVQATGFAAAERRERWFTRVEWMRLAALYGFIASLHAVGFGLLLYYSARHPALAGLGGTAYLFGLRHAFDADHIAAVDDSVRLMVQVGTRPLGTGFFFSLGHSTIVFALAAAVAFSAAAVKGALPGMQHLGGLIGAGVSGVFLWVIGVLNLLVLLQILALRRGTRSGGHSHARIDELLAKRGLLNRILGARPHRRMNRSWQMYPLGLLFGLGFDTASEVGLLAMTAAASATVLPPLGVLSLPILFAAGMTVVDTSDGVLMCKAYDWAFTSPRRRISYNLVTTGLAVAVALVIGTLELLHVLAGMLGLREPFFDWLGKFGPGALGSITVALFLFVWAGSWVLWKSGRIRGRRGGELRLGVGGPARAKLPGPRTSTPAQGMGGS